MRKEITNIEFSKKANNIHGNKYDYSKINYINSHTKIIIICNDHGEFNQMPYSHLQGKGCPKCGGTKVLKIHDFIKKAKAIHDNKYDYSQSIYKNNKSKIKIFCSVHGEFSQLAYSHLRGKGCPKCIKNYKLTTTEFVKKAKAIHDHKYDYSDVKYNGTKTKITIICKNHGKFLQSPNDHLNGHGCKECAYEKILQNTSSKPEKEFLNYLNIKKTDRQISINGYIVDAINKKENIIYEFLGDYWHGNPKIYNPKHFNKSANRTYGELYTDTFIRFDILKNKGYKIKYIWESDWNNYKNNISENLTLLEYGKQRS